MELLRQSSGHHLIGSTAVHERPLCQALYGDFPRSQVTACGRFYWETVFLALARNEETLKPGTDCTSTVGLVALFHGADPDTNRSAGLHSILVVAQRDITESLSSLAAAGLTCSMHLRIHVLQKYTLRPNYAIIAAEPAGLTLTCRGSNRHLLVIMAHKMRAFLFTNDDGVIYRMSNKRFDHTMRHPDDELMLRFEMLKIIDRSAR